MAGVGYGRIVDGQPRPYFTRREIEEGALAGRGLEILWLRDPADAFFLQIQGSGRVELPDGSVMRVGYADQNGHPFRSIGRVLIERGELTRDTASMQSIRAWARRNPDKLEALLDENPSYVFFREVPPPKYHRLSVGQEVRLRYGYFIRCESFVKNPATGEIEEIHCSYDPQTRGGYAPDGRRVKGTIHWVSAEHALDAEVRSYDRLFTVPDPNNPEPGMTFLDYLNRDSLKVQTGCKVEPSLANAEVGMRYQFERLGYFCVDPDAAKGKPVLFFPGLVRFLYQGTAFVVHGLQPLNVHHAGHVPLFKELPDAFDVFFDELRVYLKFFQVLRLDIKSGQKRSG